jgi:hypothetical protein
MAAMHVDGDECGARRIEGKHGHVTPFRARTLSSFHQSGHSTHCHFTGVRNCQRPSTPNATESCATLLKGRRKAAGLT